MRTTLVPHEQSFRPTLMAPLHTRACHQDYTALMCAADKGRAEVVPVLVEAGADVNFQNKVGVGGVIMMMIMMNFARHAASYLHLLSSNSTKTRP